MDNQHAKLLKEVNTRAAEVIEEINNTEDQSIKNALIYEFGNDAFQKGVNFGLNVKK